MTYPSGILSEANVNNVEMNCVTQSINFGPVSEGTFNAVLEVLNTVPSSPYAITLFGSSFVQVIPTQKLLGIVAIDSINTAITKLKI